MILTKLTIFEAIFTILSLCLLILVLYNFPKSHPIWKKKSQLDKIMDKIRKYNEEQIIYNTEIYGPVDSETIIIVIQVHNRLNYLQFLVDSLYRARDIERALLIFSHDYYNEKINRFIHKTNFAKYMQIFYPYSTQVYKYRFPGFETTNCFKVQQTSKNHKELCNRKADVLQKKHNYWWMVNTVFEGLEISRNITNLVVFLEEGQVVVKDFIYNLYKMNFKRKTMCPTCNILSLGTYHSTFKPPDTSTVSMSPFTAKKHSMGMAFNKTTWHRLRNCAREFCTYNDYNWDKSLEYISLSCARLHVMLLKAARVYHIGICETNKTTKSCNPTELVNKIQRDIKKKRHYLFPLNYHPEHEKSPKEVIYPSGFWNDDRDHRMCMSLTSRAITFKRP